MAQKERKRKVKKKNNFEALWIGYVLDEEPVEEIMKKFQLAEQFQKQMLDAGHSFDDEKWSQLFKKTTKFSVEDVMCEESSENEDDSCRSMKKKRKQSALKSSFSLCYTPAISCDSREEICISEERNIFELQSDFFTQFFGVLINSSYETTDELFSIQLHHVKPLFLFLWISKRDLISEILTRAHEEWHFTLVESLCLLLQESDGSFNHKTLFILHNGGRQIAISHQRNADVFLGSSTANSCEDVYNAIETLIKDSKNGVKLLELFADKDFRRSNWYMISHKP